MRQSVNPTAVMFTKAKDENVVKEIDTLTNIIYFKILRFSVINLCGSESGTNLEDLMTIPKMMDLIL